MAQKKIDAKKVAWIPPETLDRAQGQYREVLDDILVGAADANDAKGIPAIPGIRVAQYGTLVQWVDENPGDPEDGTGHFVVYDGDESDYNPILALED